MIKDGNSGSRVRFWSGVLLALLTFLYGHAYFANAEDRVVRVGIYENAPKVFTAEDGRPSGIFVDVIESIAKSEGWHLKYVTGTWTEGLDRVAKGEIDLMPDVAYTKDRAEIYSFHKVPVLSSWYLVYAPKGHNIHSILDLKGKRILVLDRSVQQAAFSRLSKGFGLDCSIIPVPDYKAMFEKVARGEADAALTNRFYGMMHAKKSGLEDTAVVLEPSDLFFAAPKDAPIQLLDTIDRHISAFKKDLQSDYYKSLKHWTSEEVRFTLPLWVKILGLVVGIILIMSFVGSVILKHQVNARTAALRRSEKKYRDIFDNAAVGIYQSTSMGKFLNVNPAFARTFGYDSPEEMIVKIQDIRTDLYVHSEDRARFIKMFKEKGEVRGLVTEFRRRDGSRCWVSIYCKAVRDERGNILYYEGTTEDISARKRLEEELAAYREHLEQLVKERTAELEIEKEKAEIADNLKSAFLATMSHELRTPLNSIIGFTGIILREKVGTLNDEQKKQLTMVQRSSRHLLALINDVLDISKIEAGQLPLACETVDLPQTIEKAVLSTQPLAEAKGLALGYDIQPEIKTIVGDVRRVEQILLNLLSNAIKFTEKGSVRIVCESDESDVIIKVIDTGMGIKPEDRETIFKSFRQIDTGTTRKYEGTGLGLSISKKLVEMMGGRIWVESTWGEGSTLGFSLPKERRNV
jgi:PAS domain S-box-containing protein